MGVTADEPDTEQASNELTAEICRQLALGNTTVQLDALADETGLSTRRVEEIMGYYEQQLDSPVDRVGGCGEEVRWRIRQED